MTVEAQEMAEIFSYLPDDVKMKHRKPGEMVFSTMYRTFLIAAMFIFASYLQNLDISRLIIKSHLIKKQQEDLSTHFQAQKDGMLIFYNDVKSKAELSLISEAN